jgi:hypothetical protein
MFDSLATLLLFAYGLAFIFHVATPIMENVQRRINYLKELGVASTTSDIVLCTAFSVDLEQG